MATNGFGNLSYQWQANGTNLPGATSSTLTLTNLVSSQAGVYTVVVTGVPNGQSLSASAKLVSSVIDLQRYAGVTVHDVIGSQYRVEYTDNLEPSATWTVATNLTLTTSPQVWIDLTSAHVPKRFYRAISAWRP